MNSRILEESSDDLTLIIVAVVMLLLVIVLVIIFCFYYFKKKDMDEIVRKENQKNIYAAQDLNRMTRVNYDNCIVRGDEIEVKVINVDFKTRKKSHKVEPLGFRGRELMRENETPKKSKKTDNKNLLKTGKMDRSLDNLTSYDTQNCARSRRESDLQEKTQEKIEMFSDKENEPGDGNGAEKEKKTALSEDRVDLGGGEAVKINKVSPKLEKSHVVADDENELSLKKRASDQQQDSEYKFLSNASISRRLKEMDQGLGQANKKRGPVVVFYSGMDQSENGDGGVIIEKQEGSEDTFDNLNSVDQIEESSQLVPSVPAEPDKLGSTMYKTGSNSAKLPEIKRIKSAKMPQKKPKGTPGEGSIVRPNSNMTKSGIFERRSLSSQKIKPKGTLRKSPSQGSKNRRKKAYGTSGTISGKMKTIKEMGPKEEDEAVVKSKKELQKSSMESKKGFTKGGVRKSQSIISAKKERSTKSKSHRSPKTVSKKEKRKMSSTGSDSKSKSDVTEQEGEVPGAKK